MVQFNFSERTIKAKVVYYGPAQSGKTTNLEQIHRLTDPGGANSLISLNTGQDRTLFFDLLPFSLGTVAGYDFKVQLYTVPGQVQYNATRRVVLAGADAVVFVADSRKSLAKDNLTAFENMKVNLLANRLVPEKVPLVLQYNKRDLPELQSEEKLSQVLNPWGRRACPAVATEGKGVLETFVAIVQDMLAAIAVKYNLKEKGLDPATVPQVVDDAFSKLMKKAAQAAPPPAAEPSSAGASAAELSPPPPSKIVVSQAPEASQGANLQAAPDTGLVSEELLHRAIRSNVELAETLSSVVKETNEGLGTILSHAELLLVYREDARDKKMAAIKSIQAEAARLRGMMQQLGSGGAPAAAAGGRPGAAPPAPRAAATKPRPASPEPSPPPAEVSELEGVLQGAIASVKSHLDSRGVSVTLRVVGRTTSPRCPSESTSRAVALMLDGISVSSPQSAITLRCEMKPVLLRGRDGSEVRRNFVMLAAAHAATLSPEEQQQVVRGTATGPLGDACRLVRELGGFVRFAPLAGSGLESRLFFPA